LKDMEILLCRHTDSNHITRYMRAPGELVLDHRLRALPLSCGHGGESVYYRKSRYFHEDRCGHRDDVRYVLSVDLPLIQKVLCTQLTFTYRNLPSTLKITTYTYSHASPTSRYLCPRNDERSLPRQGSNRSLGSPAGPLRRGRTV
jgi:hypothetical protein